MIMKKDGFSFIEILVVTTIIAVLTAVGVANFRVANQKARDGRRQGDLEQIRAALELYRTDELAYPTNDIISADIIQSSGGTTYMADVPDDPSTDYVYYYNSGGSTYTLCAALEIDTTGICAASCGSVTCNYQVVSPF